MNIKRLGAGAILSLVIASAATEAQVGKRWASEKSTYNDPVTGLEITVLTNGNQSDAKIYQTHPQWTSDGKWVIFRTAGRAAGSQAFAVNEESGDIVQLTEGSGNATNALNISRKQMKLYFIRNSVDHATLTPPAPTTTPSAGTPTGAATTSSPTSAPATQRAKEFQIIELDTGKLLIDAMAGAAKPAKEYERICATLPSDLTSAGGLAIDADESTAYFSIGGGDVGKHLKEGTEIWKKRETDRMGTGPGGIRKINLQTGEYGVVTDTPFQVGHVQCNPFVPGEIIFCHETGGDAPQRIWSVRNDGSNFRPLFVESESDWVTHEAVVGKDEVMFNLIGHQPRLRKNPTGIAVINLRTDAMRVIGQLDEIEGDAAKPSSFGGFWHCNGSFDGKWAVGDTFQGNLWLINRQTSEMKLLTTDHKMRPDHLHPTFKDDGSKILVQSGHFTNGSRLQLMLIPVPNKQ